MAKRVCWNAPILKEHLQDLFSKHCKQFALRSGKVETYPGFHSVWILDGARIHCDDKIISYLRSLGVFAVFLPAYTPFYNPIEIVFGLVKKRMQRVYQENSSKDLKMTVAEIMMSFSKFKMDKLFHKFGYIQGGRFDPTIAAPANLINLVSEETV